jgi:hypothetical protein
MSFIEGFGVHPAGLVLWVPSLLKALYLQIELIHDNLLPVILFHITVNLSPKLYFKKEDFMA